jgi:hypothetical protein
MFSLCFKCKGRNFCGRPCTIINNIRKSVEKIKHVEKNFSGTSPSIFVGRYGYPNVNVGILSPPYLDENTWMLDEPSFWYTRRFSTERVLQYRYQLINSRTVQCVKKPGRFMEIVQQIALAEKPVEAEFQLKKRPKTDIRLDKYATPIGIAAALKKVQITENPKIPHKVERITEDEMKAKEAVIELFEVTNLHHIQKIFSAGLLGLDKHLVPTRYSITAVDDIVSKNQIERIKDYPFVNQYLVFTNTYLGNRFDILLIPDVWGYEIVEAWEQNIQSDYEQYWGRKRYSDTIAGGYYAARLGVTEYLDEIKRQASVVIVRTISDSYFVPLGVWVVRETVRDAFKRKPMAFDELDKALQYISRSSGLQKRRIVENTNLLRQIIQQKKLSEFMR